MTHCTVQYEKTPAKVGTSGSTGTLATARTQGTTRTPATEGPPAGIKTKTETPTTPDVSNSRVTSNSEDIRK